MRTWTAKTTTTAHPTALIDVLTDPEAARRWAPVAFDVDELEGRRLRKGVRAASRAGSPAGGRLRRRGP